ncbi:MAG: shikimate kinase [Candidatus Hydrothermarchaeales archaeon]
MKNIVLTGFMGAGKSVVGRKLAERLGWEVIDTDDVIEQDSGMIISDIFQGYGEDYFRELEKKAVKKVSELEDHVIITGGGVVINKENIENLRKNGVVVYLHAVSKVLYLRIKDQTHRPLLQVEDPMQTITELMKIREPFYANHDIRIDTTNLEVDQVVDKILEKAKPQL